MNVTLLVFSSVVFIGGVQIHKSMIFNPGSATLSLVVQPSKEGARGGDEKKRAGVTVLFTGGGEWLCKGVQHGEYYWARSHSLLYSW